MLDQLSPENPAFIIIDGFFYLLVFALMLLVLRLSLRRIAGDQADDSPIKIFLCGMMTLTVAGFSFGIPGIEKYWYLIPIPIVLLGTFVLVWLCWVSFLKGLAVTLIFMISGVAFGYGGMQLLNKFLPENRVTMAGQLAKNMGLLDKFAGQESAPMMSSNMVRNAKIGASLYAESIQAAVYLLQHPDAIEKMTADHTADLRALGLIIDGEEKPTPEQLAELGITYEEAKDAQKGIDFLKGMSNEVVISDQDVADVMSLLKSIRPDGSDVTANDAVAAIREAIRKVDPSMTNKLAAMKIGGPADNVTTQAAVAAEAPASSSMFAGTVAAPSKNTTVTGGLPRDPWAMLSPSARIAWRASQTALIVKATFKRSDGQTLAMVNGAIVKKGEIVETRSEDRTFRWRLAEVSDYRIKWEPVLKGETNGAAGKVITF